MIDRPFQETLVRALDESQAVCLLSHAVVGASWEGFVIENLLSAGGEGVAGHYYRTSGGAEIDLLLVFPDGERLAVEIKRSLAPRPERGLHEACADLAPARTLSTLMALQAGLPLLQFSSIAEKKQEYFGAVQAGLDKDYKPMQRLFVEIIERSLASP